MGNVAIDLPEIEAAGDVGALSGEDLGSSLRDRLNRLHETLYRRGGIRPVNAAIEELSKIVLLQLKNARHPNWKPSGTATIAEILDPARVRSRSDASEVKVAFSKAIRLPEFDAILPDGRMQPVWPPDEPFRLDRPDVLAEALDALDPTVLRAAVASEHYDVLGTAFDALLRGKYDHGGGLATYLTPHGVATMLARICFVDLEVPDDWTAGNPLFADPCCGTGRFLVAGLREAHRVSTEQFDAGPKKDRFATAFGGSAIVGADQASASVAKARLNLLLFGVTSPCVFQVTDSIVDPTLDGWRDSMQLILTNPPFGDGKYDDPQGVERTRAGLEGLRSRRSVDPGLAFFVRCLDLLRDGGRLGIILPDGLVDGAAIRAALLGSDTSTRLCDVTIEANISLPSATFALSGTVARTSALVVRKGGAKTPRAILARAAHVGYLKQANSAVVDPMGDELPRIAEITRTTLMDAATTRDTGLRILSDSPSVVASPLKGLTSLDPARVDPEALRARSDVLAGSGQPLRELIRPTKTRPHRADGKRPFISVLHVDEFGAVAWHDAEQYLPTTPGRLVPGGHLLISMLNPRKLRATVIPSDEEILCSSEFGVFEADDPWAIVVLLNDQRVRAQLSPLGRGTSSSRRRIDARELLEVAVPEVATEIHERGEDLSKAHDQMRQGEKRAAKSLGLLPSSP